MHIPKNYFHDRVVLLLLTVNTFLATLISAMILLRLDGSRFDDYIVQYRSNLGLNAFKTGSSGAMIGFIVFAVAILVFHTVLSVKTYHVRKHLAHTVLAMASLLLVITLIVSNALLVLR